MEGYREVEVGDEDKSGALTQQAERGKSTGQKVCENVCVCFSSRTYESEGATQLARGLCECVSVSERTQGACGGCFLVDNQRLEQLSRRGVLNKTPGFKGLSLTHQC